MGYEKDCFPDGVPQAAFCGICLKVPKNPFFNNNCGDIYCRGCVASLLVSSEKPICPQDDKKFTEANIVPPDDKFFVMYNCLRMKCEFFEVNYFN